MRVTHKNLRPLLIRDVSAFGQFTVGGYQKRKGVTHE
jgi:hypothetical protein